MYFSFDLENARYVATHQDFQDFIAYSNTTRILGTNSWTLINDSKVYTEERNQKKINILKIDSFVQILNTPSKRLHFLFVLILNLPVQLDIVLT